VDRKGKVVVSGVSGGALFGIIWSEAFAYARSRFYDWLLSRLAANINPNDPRVKDAVEFFALWGPILLVAIIVAGAVWWATRREVSEIRVQAAPAPDSTSDKFAGATKGVPVRDVRRAKQNSSDEDPDVHGEELRKKLATPGKGLRQGIRAGLSGDIDLIEALRATRGSDPESYEAHIAFLNNAQRGRAQRLRDAFEVAGWQVNYASRAQDHLPVHFEGIEASGANNHIVGLVAKALEGSGFGPVPTKEKRLDIANSNPKWPHAQRTVYLLIGFPPEVAQARKLTAVQRERCSEAITDVFDFVGSELVPFRQRLNDIQYPDAPGLAGVRHHLGEYIARLSQIGHQHHLYFRMMDHLDITPMIRSLEELRDPLAAYAESLDWPPPARADKIQKVQDTAAAFGNKIQRLLSDIADRQDRFIDQ